MDKKKAVKVGITAAIVLGGLVFLFQSGLASGDYMKNVDEVVGDQRGWQGKRLKVHGFVVPGSIMKRIAGNQTEFKFKVQHKGKVMDAHYIGVVPDEFKDDGEVVCTGKLADNGTLEVAPSGVLAKCPSKYEAQKDDRRKAAGL
jgi:cytochrome c-type biogenesis protein CcmE